LSFAGLVRQLRGEVKLTQEELAQAAGLSPRAVSDLERGINPLQSSSALDTTCLGSPRRSGLSARLPAKIGPTTIDAPMHRPPS
jgi:DNA-binding XRE family transcriptional regulator